MGRFDIVFLGTGGGRFVTMTQKRRTAGIRVVGEGLNIHLDPGPGALVYSISEGFDPQRLNAILVSHCHPDHYTDAEVLIEAMTHGTTKKRGILAAPRSVLRGSDAGHSRAISDYHQQMPEQVIEVSAGLSFQTGDTGISVTEAKHTDPDAVGFRFHTAKYGDFAYTSDTEYFNGLTKCYAGVRLLILCVMRPEGKPWKGHMTTNDAIRIIEESHPEQAILTHLGMRMLLENPEKEAKLVEEKTGVPTTAAIDGMRLGFGETIVVNERGKNGQQGLNKFL